MESEEEEEEAYPASATFKMSEIDAGEAANCRKKAELSLRHNIPLPGIRRNLLIK